MNSTTTQSNSADDQFSPGDVERILAETFVDRVEYQSVLASTNNRALELAGEDLARDSSCTLVLADRQTDGRGRGANRWWSAEGALTFSLLLEPDAIQLPTSRWPQLSLTTGLAVCNAIEELLGDVNLRLKWPNDVYLGERKLCGILTEATAGSRRNLIIGIGVNVNNSMDTAPSELREKAISLCDVMAIPLRRTDVLIAIVQQLATQLNRFALGEEMLQEQWRRRCMLTGRTVHVKLPLRRTVGICRGIDDDGALVLESPVGIERCISGVIVQID